MSGRHENHAFSVPVNTCLVTRDLASNNTTSTTRIGLLRVISSYTVVLPWVIVLDLTVILSEPSRFHIRSNYNRYFARGRDLPFRQCDAAAFGGRDTGLHASNDLVQSDFHHFETYHGCRRRRFL